MTLEKILCVNPVIPATGSNAGKQMFVINGKHWSKLEPRAEDTHIVLEDTVSPKDGKTYTNVVGFSVDTRMDIASKIAIITSVDAGYSVAIASLLK